MDVGKIYQVDRRALLVYYQDLTITSCQQVDTMGEAIPLAENYTRQGQQNMVLVCSPGCDMTLYYNGGKATL